MNDLESMLDSNCDDQIYSTLVRHFNSVLTLEQIQGGRHGGC